MEALELLDQYEFLVVHPRRGPRDRENPIEDCSEKDFFDRYRLSKAGFLAVIDVVRPYLLTRVKRTNNPLSPEFQLLIALRFYASGDFQISNGDNFRVHKSTVCRILPRVTSAIASMASVQKLIHYRACPETQRDFYAKSGLPGITGAVDGVQINIRSGGGPVAEVYRNRHGDFALNAMGVCNQKLEFLYLVTGNPGSVHDSTIFQNSLLCWQLETGVKTGRLVGDSAYKPEHFMFTPIPKPRTRLLTPAEIRYNRAHKDARNCIERAFGVFKRRFPSMQKGLTIRLDRIPNTVTACGVLHNLCIKFKQADHSNDERDLFNFDDSDDGDADNDGDGDDGPVNQSGIQARNAIMRHLT